MFSPPEQYVTVAELTHALPMIGLLTVTLSVVCFFLVIYVGRLFEALVWYFEKRKRRAQREKAMQSFYQGDRNAGIDDSDIPF